jgi:hypothetical protein
MERRYLLHAIIVGMTTIVSGCADEAREKGVSSRARQYEVNYRRQLVAKLRRGWTGGTPNEKIISKNR